MRRAPTCHHESHGRGISVKIGVSLFGLIVDLRSGKRFLFHQLTFELVVSHDGFEPSTLTLKV